MSVLFLIFGVVLIGQGIGVVVGALKAPMRPADTSTGAGRRPGPGTTGGSMSPLALQVDDVGSHRSELAVSSDRDGSAGTAGRSGGHWLSFLASQGLSIIRHWR